MRDFRTAMNGYIQPRYTTWALDRCKIQKGKVLSVSGPATPQPK